MSPESVSSIFQPPPAQPLCAAGQGLPRGTEGNGGVSTRFYPSGIKLTASLPLTYCAEAMLEANAMAVPMTIDHDDFIQSSLW